MSDQALWSGLGLISALDSYVLGSPPAAVCGVSIDSRTIQPGELFFAVRGVGSDGHDWVRAAFSNGAAAAVIAGSRVDDVRDAGPLYVVDDTLAALGKLAVAARARTSAKVAAITGSVGKTSTKEALRLALADQGLTHASVASYNNHWGVPLSLARMPRQTQFGAFEVGMNHAGEIRPLTRLIRPHVAVVTTIAPVHLENLGTIEAIADAKAEIFEGLEPGGLAVIHRDVAQFEQLCVAAVARGARIASFGEMSDADARLVRLEHFEEKTRVSATFRGRPLEFLIGAPGRHFALNALSVLLAVEGLGGDVGRAAESLANFLAPAGRGRRVRASCQTGSFTLIDESYNANPASMRAAIDVLGRTEISVLANRIAVLGDMLELGPEAERMHMALRGVLVDAGVNQVFATGPLMKALFDDLPEYMRAVWAPSAADLLEPLKRGIAGGDVVMVKGSNSMKMGPLAAALEHIFDTPPAAAGG